MPRAATAIALSPEQEAELRRRARIPSAARKDALRARIVLRAAEGATNSEIARELGLSLPTVSLWRTQFARAGLAGLADRPRSGRPRAIDEQTVQRVLAKTLEPPPPGEPHWSVRRLARETGVSSSTVHRIWRQHRLKPYRARIAEGKGNPQLVAKVVDIVGLYLDPPAGALVLWVDERTPVQAFARAEPIPPVRRGLRAGLAPDNERTTSLYAALEHASGQGVSAGEPPHRQEGFLAFLRRLVGDVPDGELHLVLDSPSTAPEVESGPAGHARLHFHFTPSGASWLTLVEIWFSILTRHDGRRASNAGVGELLAAIERFVAGYERHARPFAWTRRPVPAPSRASEQQPTSETERRWD